MLVILMKCSVLLRHSHFTIKLLLVTIPLFHLLSYRLKVNAGRRSEIVTETFEFVWIIVCPNIGGCSKRRV
jgi:hypothetical protein